MRAERFTFVREGRNSRVRIRDLRDVPVKRLLEDEATGQTRGPELLGVLRHALNGSQASYDGELTTVDASPETAVVAFDYSTEDAVISTSELHDLVTRWISFVRARS